MALGHDPLSTRPLSDVAATPAAQGGDPAPLPHLGLLLGGGGGTAFELTPTAALALTASLSVAGSVGWGVELDAPLNLDLSGALTAAGSLGLDIGVAQTAGVAMSGTLTAAGTLGFFGPFELTPTQALALTGSMSVAGDVLSSVQFNLAPTAALALSASLSTAGALGAEIGLSGSVGLSGSMAAAGALGQDIGLSGGVALSGALSAAGDLEIQQQQFVVTPTGPVALVASLSVAGDVESSDQPITPPGSGGGASAPRPGGLLHKHKLLQAFRDKQERDEAVRKLPKATERERVVLRKAAVKLIKAEPVNYKELEERVAADLAKIGQKPAPHHLDWLLYFLRVLAYAPEQAAIIKAQQQAEEEAAFALMLMLMEV